MEQQILTITFKSTIISTLPQSILLTLIQFLDDGSLQHLQQFYKQQHYQTNAFSLIKAQLFLRKYINSFDRLLYFNLFSEAEFIKQDIQHISGLTISFYKQLNLYCDKFNEIFRSFQLTLQDVQKSQQIIQSLKYALQNPDLPFPKMRREGIGMFCNSHLQYYLVDLKFGIQQDLYLEQGFEQLKILLESQKQQKQSNKNIEIDMQMLEIIMKVRVAPELINSTNFQQFLIKGQTLHNTIVFFVAITQNSIQSTYKFIKSFHDPLRLFAELVVRYNMFRNYILSIEVLIVQFQEKCSFLFQIYHKEYEDMFINEQDYIPFSFWRIALGIWYRKMKDFHEIGDQIFCYILTKIRYSNIVNSCLLILQDYKAQGQSIKNKLELCEYQLKLKQTLFHQKKMRINSQIEQYLEANIELYQYLMTEYLQYMVDLSVNEFTVHWCGHTKHTLDKPYMNFQENFLEYTEQYHDYLRVLVDKLDASREKKQQILALLLEQQISFIYNNYYAKPVTVSKIIKKSQQLLKIGHIEKIKQNSHIKEEYMLMTKYSHTSTGSYSLQKSKIPQKAFQKLFDSTKQKDSILTHYNTKHFENNTYQQHAKSGSLIPLAEQNLEVSQKLKYSITLEPQQKISMIKSMNLHDISIKNKLKDATNLPKNIKLSFDFVESQCEEMQIDQRQVLQQDYQYTQQQLQEDYHDNNSQMGKSLRIGKIEGLSHINYEK